MKKNLITEQILAFLYEAGEMLPLPLETPYKWIKRTSSNYGHKNYTDLTRQLHRRGFVQITKVKDKKFLKLTAQGSLSYLQKSLKNVHYGSWDKKWRVIIFDIPENAKIHRDRLRFALKKLGYEKLQASVFISPYPIPGKAVEYLKRSGLQNFLRFMRVDKIDDDSGLQKRFKLK